MTIRRITALAAATAAAGALLTTGTASANQLFDVTLVNQPSAFLAKVSNHSNNDVICTFAAYPPFGTTFAVSRVFTSKAHLTTPVTVPAPWISRTWHWSVSCKYPLSIELGLPATERGSVFH